MTDETDPVVDVLTDLDDMTGVRAMLAVLEDGDDPALLDYEDWVRPLKLTGGRVCLHLGGLSRTPQYVAWESNGLVGAARGDVMNWEPDEVVGYLRFAIESAPHVVDPVLREDTPFGGDES